MFFSLGMDLLSSPGEEHLPGRHVHRCRQQHVPRSAGRGIGSGFVGGPADLVLMIARGRADVLVELAP
jgi:hypothetical protein